MEKDQFGDTPLHVAAIFGNKAFIRAYLDSEKARIEDLKIDDQFWDSVGYRHI